jgi:hypothetical protein
MIMRNNRQPQRSYEFTVGKWMICFSGQFKKWVTKVARDVLAIWIKTFGCVELTETSVDTSIP